MKTAALPTQKTKAANKTKNPAPNATPAAKPRRLEEIAESKKGLFAILPTLLSVEPGFNERLDYGDLRALAEDIFHNGLETPFKVRKIPGTETILIVRGHRRHKAITGILIPAGRWHLPDGTIKPVDCQPEEPGTSEFQRLASQLSSNTGLPYNLLEKANIYKRLLALDPALKPADLARRFGETKQAVSDALRLSREGCHAIQTAILAGRIAASTAITLIKQTGPDHSAQEAALAAATATAGTASHITPRHLPPTPATSRENQLPGTQTFIADPSGEEENADANDDQSTTQPPAFRAYTIRDVPEGPISPGSTFHHETDRLVLTTPEAYGLQRLHLLSVAITPETFAFGYRIDHIEHLPDTTHSASLETDPLAGYQSILHSALRRDPELTAAQKQQIQDLLTQSLDTYFPATGTPAEPQTLTFVATSQDQQQTGSQNPGFRQTLNAKPTGGGGGRTGGGKHQAPDKRLTAIEKLLDDLAEKNIGNGRHITTAEIVLSYLNNETGLKSLRTHLTAP